jgi:DNA-binding beta-propeller fold protein YncE
VQVGRSQRQGSAETFRPTIRLTNMRAGRLGLSMAPLVLSGTLLAACASGPGSAANCSLMSRQQILALAVRADVRVDRISARLMPNEQFERWFSPGSSGTFPSTMVWAVAISGYVYVMGYRPPSTRPNWVVRAYNAGTGDMMAGSSGGPQPGDKWPAGFDGLPDAAASCPAGPPPAPSTTSIPKSTISVAASLTLEGQPAQVGVDPGTHRIFVSSHNPDDRLTVFDGTVEPPKAIATVKVEFGDGNLAIDPGTHRLFVLAGQGLEVVDGAATPPRVIANIHVADAPTNVAVDPSTHRIYVTDGNQQSVVVLDGQPVPPHILTVVAGLGVYPDQMAIDVAGHRLFVACLGSDNWVQTIDIGPSVPVLLGRPTRLGGQPGGMAFDAATKRLLVGIATGREIDSVIRMVSSNAGPVRDRPLVSVGNDPASLAIGSVSGNIFVTNTYSDSVTVLATSAASLNALGSLKVGNRPVFVAVDHEAHRAFVLNAGIWADVRTNLAPPSLTVIDGA